MDFKPGNKFIGWDLARLLTLSFVMRLVLRLMFFVPAKDGLTFAEIAACFSRGDFKAALSHEYHPLYPFLISVFSKFTADFIDAGLAVSLLFGFLLVIPVYLASLRLFDRKAAVISSVFCIFHPYLLRFSSNVLSESIYLFFAGFAFLCGLEGVKNRKTGYFIAVSFFSVFAYLVRPEGAGVLLAVVSALLFIPFQGLRFLKRLWLAFLVVAVFLIMVFPYIYTIKQFQGEWRLTQKTRITSLLGMDKEEEIVDNAQPVPEPVEEYPLKAAPQKPEGIKLAVKGSEQLIRKILQGVFLPVAVFALIGIAIRKKYPRSQAEFIPLLAFLIYISVLFMVAIRTDISYRHTAFLMLLGCVYSGAGVCEFTSLFSKKTGSRLLWAILFVCIIAMSVKGLKPVGMDKECRKTVGIWISRNYPGEVIMTSRMARIPFYAGAEHFDYTDYKKGFILKEAQERGIKLAVINLLDMSEADNDLLSLLNDKNSEKIYSRKFGEKDEIVVYELFLNGRD
ncbi:MAG: glycosyltransferase family 39 protein [Candidatus Aureabacteria bacterium]|nr:glycosyltransferase family 39 protein [Candidatus Auribacterota bacterium]